MLEAHLRVWNDSIKTKCSCLLQIQDHHSPRVLHLSAWKIDHIRLFFVHQKRALVVPR